MVNKVFSIILLILFSSIGTSSYAQEEKSIDSSRQQSTINQIKRPKYDEVYHAMVSDLVVVGEVIEVMDLPGPSSELFHSEAIVKIDSVLRGMANFGTLILLRMSGPVSDDRNISPIWSSDGIFKKGEHGIFFLHRPETDNFLVSPFIQSHFKTYDGKESLRDLPDSVFYGDHVCMDIISNGGLKYPWGTFKLGTVAKEIRTLLPSTEH